MEERIFQHLADVLSSVHRLEERVIDMDVRTKHVEQLVHDLTEADRGSYDRVKAVDANAALMMPASYRKAHVNGQCLVHGTHPWTTYQQLLRNDSLSDALITRISHDPGFLNDAGEDRVTKCTMALSTAEVGPCAEGSERRVSSWSGLLSRMALDRGTPDWSASHGGRVKYILVMQIRAKGTMQTPLESHPVVDQYFQDETTMWHKLKSGPFCANIRQCVRRGRPLGMADWFRMLMLVPFTLSMEQLVRIFDEEDTISALTSVVSIKYHGLWDIPYLLLTAPMHPQSRVRVRWDTYILLVLFTVCIITPYLICFDVQAGKLTAFGVWETVVDASFSLDIVLNFRTAFIESNESDALISSRSKIASRYLSGLFALDFVSTVPWDLVMTNEALGLVQLFKVSRIVKLVRIMRILKLIRILRLLKAPTILKQLEERLGRVIVRIGSLTCTVIFILHIFACVFHYVAVLDEQNGTWIELSGIVNPASKWDRYVTAMYWAMSTMATVGYGDVTPIQVPEKLVAMAGMMIGVTVFAYIMGTVSSLLSSFNAQSMRAQERQRQLDSFCRTHRIPPVLARKLSQYYDRVLGKQVHQEDLELVSGLSSALRQQVLLILHAEIFDKIPFFKDKHPQFLEQLIPHLKLEFYAASDYVIWEEDISTEMYFIVEGMLEVRVNVAVSPRKAEPEGTSPTGDAAASKRNAPAAMRSDSTFRRVAIKWQEQRQSVLLQQQQALGTSLEPPGRLSVIRQPLSHVAAQVRRWVGGNSQPPQHSGHGAGAPGREHTGAWRSDSSSPSGSGPRDPDEASDLGAVVLETSQNPFAAGTKAWVGQEERAPRRAWSVSARQQNNAVAPEPGLLRRTLSFGRDCQNGSGPHEPVSPSLGLQMRRKRAQKHIVDRMIGMQATPFKRIGRLDAGQYFGEVSCWTGAQRTASVVAITSAELFSLQRASLIELARQWPEVATELRFKNEAAPAQLEELKAKSLAGQIPALGTPRRSSRGNSHDSAHAFVPCGGPPAACNGASQQLPVGGLTRDVAAVAAVAAPLPGAAGRGSCERASETAKTRASTDGAAPPVCMPSSAPGDDDAASEAHPVGKRRVSFCTASRRAEWGVDIHEAEPGDLLEEMEDEAA